jgi:autotransporter-associated beta strand protein
VGNKTLTLQGSTAGTGEFAGAIVDSGTGNRTAVTKANSSTGRWILSGNNTYTGNTTINTGTLQFAKTASLYNGTTANWTASSIIVQNGGTLAVNVGGAGEFDTGNVTTLLTNLGGLGGAVGLNGLRAGSTIGFDTTNAGGSFTIADIIANSTGSGGAIGVAKLGTGTLILSGNTTFTNSSTISAGTLEIGSTGRLESWGLCRQHLQ